MLYTIGTSNNYPSRAYGAFQSVKGCITDYLMFEDPEPIHLNIRIDFTDFEAIAAKWDCISIDKVGLIDKNVARKLFNPLFYLPLQLFEKMNKKFAFTVAAK